MSLKTYLNPNSIEGGTINRTHINVNPNDSNNLLASTEKPGVVQLVDDRNSMDTDKAPTARVISDINTDIEIISDFISRSNSIKPNIGAVLDDGTIYSGTDTCVYLKLVGNFYIKLYDGLYFSKILTLDKSGNVINNTDYGTNKEINEHSVGDYGLRTILCEIRQKDNSGRFGKKYRSLDSVIKYITFDCIELDTDDKFSYDIDNYIGTGEYVICGSSNKCLHLPIINNGYIYGNLKVISDIDTATQILTLLNVVGGDGNIYTRTYQNGVWEPWGKMQTNVEVGAIGVGRSQSFDNFIDNGMYSGVNYYWEDESNYIVGAETFVLISINGYLTGAGVTQLKYSIKTNGKIDIQTRLGTRNSDETISWTSWNNINDTKEIIVNVGSDISLLPNVYYNLTRYSEDEFKITFDKGVSGYMNNYMFQISFGENVSEPAIQLPDGILWANGNAPIFEGGKTYQISVINNLGVFTEFY